MKYIAPQLEYVWLGSSDVATEGSFVWLSNGDALTYTRWETGQPNNYRNQDCVVFNFKLDWNDAPCSNRRNYICQTDRRGA